VHMSVRKSFFIFFRGLIAVVLPATALASGWTFAGRAEGQSAFRNLALSQQASSAYTPSQIATAYDFAPIYKAGINGTGQTVALIELDAPSTSDLTQFDQTYSLPSPKIKQYYVGRKKFKVNAGEEATLDVEWLHALAPGASIQIYYLKTQAVNPKSWQEMGSVLRSAAANGARIVSVSLGTCRASKGYMATDSALASLEQKGVSVFVASGDDGSNPGPTRDCGSLPGVSYPAGDPWVVAVGGTSLQLNGDSTIALETAWKLSGGGLVAKFQRPAWQQAATLPADAYRWAPDVSFVADPSTGVRVYFRGHWHQVGGTSLGAPGWAAAWALIRASAQQAGVSVGAAPSLIYKIGNSSTYPQAFHEITEGSNGLYDAGPGWNAVTGWGTPDVANLATAVQAVASAG
jgi:kumamolisin